MEVNRIADVPGVHFSQKKEDSIFDEVKKDLEVVRANLDREALLVLRKQLMADKETITKKLEWVEGMLGNEPKIKTKRAPHGTMKLVTEGLERYFKQNRGKLLTGAQLREVCKASLNGFQPSEAMYNTALADLKKRFNIVASGAPQLRTYKLENV